jgi:hypothetical protein
MQLRYAFRLYPDAAQRTALARAFECARVVFNDAVRAREDSAGVRGLRAVVDQFLLAGLGAGLADSSIKDDRRAVFEFVRFLGQPVRTAGPEEVDRFLTALRCGKKLGLSTLGQS